MLILLPKNVRRLSFSQRSVAVVVLSASLLFGGAAGFQSLASDWPRWRGPDFNGISKETGWSVSWPQQGPRQLWKVNVGTGFSSVAVSSGRVYTMGNDNNLESIYCLDVGSGKVLWKHSYANSIDANLYEGGPNATPTVDGDAVYSFSRKGLVLALDAGDGHVRWSINLHDSPGVKIPDWGFSGSPLVEGNLLIINAGSAGVALVKSTGKVAWSSAKESAGYASPIPFNEGQVHAVLLFSIKALSAVNPADGRLLWEFPWKTSWGVNAADPVPVGNRIFISSGYNQGCAFLHVADNKVSVLWQNKNMRNHFNSSVAVGDFVYGFDESDLKCLDLKSGEAKWSEHSLGKGSLTVADDKLIILGEKGELVVADALPEAFKPRARAQVLGGKCWTSPVLANGRIYCRNARGDLICADISGK